MSAAPPDGPSYRAVFGTADSLAAIDEVIACAHQAIRVFDASLGAAFDTPARAEKLRAFLVAGRAHRLHVQQPRAIVALHSPVDAIPIAQRFEEIWELSEPAVSATTLGL